MISVDFGGKLLLKGVRIAVISPPKVGKMHKIIDVDFFKRRNKVRNYLHFDKKISDQNVFNYVLNKENISKHSFFPTISYILNEKKIFRKNRSKTKIKKTDFKEKQRLINFPSHIDGNIYAYYSKILEEKYEFFLKENNLNENIIAFRKVTKKNPSGKTYSLCNIHFTKNVFDYINKKQNCFVLCLDISGFFDNLDHEIMKRMWTNLLEEKKLPRDHFQVYKSLCNYAYVNKKDLYKALGLSLNSRTLHKRMDRLCDINTFRNQIRNKGLIKRNLKNKGIPQGSPISGMLSNIYMIDFDKQMLDLAKSADGQYFRYCDDMIFILNNSNIDDIKELISYEIKKIKLKINDKKTQNIVFKNGKVIQNNPPSFNHPNKLQYLGILYDGENVFLRETGLSKFHYKMRKSIRMRTAHYIKIKNNGHHNNHDIYMRTLYTRYTYIGKRNYISYAYRISNVFDSKNIKRQIRGHFNIFNNYLEKNNP